MSLKIDRLQLEIIINNDQARKSLRLLDEEAKQLRRDLKKVPEGSDEWNRITNRLKSIQQQHDKLISKLGIEKLTIKELGQRQRELNSIMRNLDPSSAGYKKLEKQLIAVKTRQAQLRTSMNRTHFSVKKMAAGVNHYFGLVAAGVAAFSGFVLGIKQMIVSNAELTDSFADVRKTTGLTIKEVKELYRELKKIDTRTGNRELLSLARIAGKLGVEGKENILGFVRAADQISVALAEDLGGDTEEAIRQIGKLVDIFELEQQFGLEDSLLKVGSSINALGASSTANEGYIVEFSKRVAGIAPNARIGIGDIIGLAATLDQFGQTSEVSATVFGKLIVAIGRDIPKYAHLAGMSIADFSKLLETDANEAVLTLLESAKSTKGGMEGVSEALGKMGIDGQRSAGVIGVLSKRTEALREQQALANEEFRKGTSLLTEYNIKNTTLGAKLDKLRKDIYKLITMPGLQRWFESLVDGTRNFIHWIKANASALKTLFNLIKIAVVYFVTYKIAMIAIAYRTKIATALHYAYLIAVDLLTGKITLATVATNLFNTATKANVIGALIGVLFAVGTAFHLFRRKVKNATTQQREFNDAVREGKDIMDDNKALEDRAKVIDQMTESQLKKFKSDAKNQLTQIERLDEIKLVSANKHIELAEKVKKAESEITKLYDYEAKASAKLRLTFMKIDLSVSEKNLESITQMTQDATAEQLKSWVELADKRINLLNGNNGTESYIKTIEDLEKELDNLKDARKRINIEDQKALDINADLILAKEEEIDKYAEYGKKFIAEEKKRVENEKKFRASLIHGSKSLLDQEKSAFENRLKQAGLFGKEKEKMTTEDLEVLELLEKQFLTNIEKINADVISHDIQRQQELFDAITAKRKTDHNAQLLALGNDEKAKKALKKQFEKEELLRQVNFLNHLKTQLSAILKGDDWEGLNLEGKLLSDEEKQNLMNKLLELGLKVSEINLLLYPEDDGTKAPFGLSEDKWEGLLGKIQKGIALARQLAGAFSAVSQHQTAQENAEFDIYEKQRQQKLDDIEEDFEQGRLTDEQYFEQKKALEDDLDEKRAELTFKQAKRERTMRIYDSIINTASAVVAALGAKPWGPWNFAYAATVGALGLVQTGLIASEPLPQYADGNYKNVIGQSDGKKYRAKVESRDHSSGLYSEPTYVPGFGLFGETSSPELVFNPKDTQKIIDSPALINAINHTLGVRQFASGNFPDFNKSPEFSEPSSTAQTMSYDTDMKASLDRFSSVTERLLDEGIEAHMLMSKFEKVWDKYNKIKDTLNIS